MVGCGWVGAGRAVPRAPSGARWPVAPVAPAAAEPRIGQRPAPLSAHGGLSRPSRRSRAKDAFPRPQRGSACPRPRYVKKPFLSLCETSKFGGWFCTHTAHDGGPGRGDSLVGVISAIVRGGVVAPALRPVSTAASRVRAAAADPPGPRQAAPGRGPVERAPQAPAGATGGAVRAPRAASHCPGVPTLADNPSPVPPCGIASKQTGHSASWRCGGYGGAETVLPSTSRNGARQEPEDNADQAGRSQGRVARKGGSRS